ALLARTRRARQPDDERTALLRRARRELVEEALDRRDVGEAVQPLAGGAQLGGGLRPAQDERREQRDRLRRHAERAAEVVLVARDARAARLERQRERLQRVDRDLHVALARR